MVNVQLPAEIATALTNWATQENIDPDDAADAVRAVLVPGDMWITTTSGSRVIETHFKFGDQFRRDIETVLVIPRHEMTALEYQQQLHTDDGSIHTDSCHCEAHTLTRVTAGQTITIGEWTWTGTPHSLTGLRTNGKAGQ